MEADEAIGIDGVDDAADLLLEMLGGILAVAVFAVGILFFTGAAVVSVRMITFSSPAGFKFEGARLIGITGSGLLTCDISLKTLFVEAAGSQPATSPRSTST